MLLITGMTTLKREQEAFKNQVYAKNSAVARGAQIRKYLEFVNLYCDDRVPFPVVLFATWLACPMKHSSIINYLSGLNYFFKVEWTATDRLWGVCTSAILKGIRRKKGDPPHRAAPLLPGSCVGYLGS